MFPTNTRRQACQKSELANRGSLTPIHHWLLIADSHVDPDDAESARNFRMMLEQIRATSANVVFLGDIFDLWIAIPRIEHSIQRHFVRWCAEERAHRSVGFVEGNHEFFVHRCHMHRFSWSTEREFLAIEGGLLFVHGDWLNTDDRAYRRFRRCTTHPVTRLLFRAMPFAQTLAKKIKQTTIPTNLEHKLHFPQSHIQTYAQTRFAEGVQHIFVGHFHRFWEFHGSGRKALHVLPAWQMTGEVGLFDGQTQALTVLPWQQAVARLTP